jgi:hypothetical protein
VRVAPEPRAEPEAWLEAAEVLASERPPHRAAACQPPLARPADAGCGARIAGKHGVLLADQPDARPVEHPPERCQLRRDRARREHVRGLRPPDEALQRPVTQHGPAERRPSQGSARELAIRLTGPPGALGDDLVELPGVCHRGGTQGVAKARAELHAPRDPRRGREMQELLELRQRAGQPLRAGVVREQLLRGPGLEPATLPEPAGLDVEDRRVPRLWQLVHPRREPISDPVAADVHRRPRRQPGTARGRDDRRQLARLEVGEDQRARVAKSAGRYVSPA